MQEDFLKRWQKEYLLDLQSYHQVRRPKGRSMECCVGDIISVTLRKTNGTNVSRTMHLVIPLEIDQAGEDVED
jgi:hypothetical protein